MPETRRVVIATTDFRPMIGGVAEHLHHVAEALTPCASVTVATPVPASGAAWPHSYDVEPLPPVPDRRLGHRFGDTVAPLRKLNTGAYFLAQRRYARDIVRAIHRRQPDAELLVGIWDTTSHFWCEECRAAGIKYTLLAYGVEIVLPLYGRLPEWRRQDFQRAERVVACSSATAALAASRFELSRPPEVVHPIAAEPFSGPEIERRADGLRRQLGAGPVLLSVGRLVPRKGFADVVASVADLRRRHPGIRYVVIGDGVERTLLEEKIRALDLQHHVVLLGAVDDATKWAAYRTCDLFVMPCGARGGADWEGFGIVFAEAARAGRPVVAGRSGGVADAVRDGETGVLIDPDDPSALREAVDHLLADAAARARMGAAALRLASARFTPAALQRQLMAGLGWSTR